MWDAIVIGSGIGGLTAAGLLASVAGRRVLVLEKHTEPGGLTHVFRRDGASWDVGLHYVGEMAPGTPARALFDHLSGGELNWNRMVDGFDRFVYPGLEFVVPSDPAQYEERLVAAFPDEAAAIRRYFRDVRRAVRWAVLGFQRGMVPRPVEPLLRALQRVTAGDAARTTKAYLDAHFRSPQLRALLASQWGDYGLPPSRSAFAIHAMIVHHYRRGAWFPEGGAGRIARTFEKTIERAGGEIRVAQEVVGIRVEGGRAVGVRVVDRRGPQPCERLVDAPVVISDVGAAATYRRLLPTDGEVDAATAPMRRLIDGLGAGPSAVTLYLRLKADARSLGVQGENLWINRDFDHDDTAAHTRGLLAGDPRRIYVSFPSIKSGETRLHTAEIIAFADAGAFDAWRDTPKGNRGADYSALKERIAAGLLRLAETAIPGLAGLVAYSELSTPLTVEHYTSHAGGAFYGLPATPERYRSPLPGPRTPVEGLYLAGQDAGCLGILGAAMGGMGAACQVLGPRGYPMIQAALRRPREASAAAGPLPAGKRRAVLAAKQRLAAGIWQLDFRVEGGIEGFAPGQFARLQVGPGDWRDYSIAGLQGDLLRLLVSTRTGGRGSQYAEAAAAGDATVIEAPLGQYTLAPGERRPVFVATGTGLAPFVPMFDELRRRGRLQDATLLFGCRTNADDLTVKVGDLPGKVVRCVSGETAPAGGLHGRVTDALAALDFEPDSTDFYLCGSSAMVADARALLERRGARQLHVEPY